MTALPVTSTDTIVPTAPSASRLPKRPADGQSAADPAVNGETDSPGRRGQARAGRAGHDVDAPAASGKERQTRHAGGQAAQAARRATRGAKTDRATSRKLAAEPVEGRATPPGVDGETLFAKVIRQAAEPLCGQGAPGIKPHPEGKAPAGSEQAGPGGKTARDPSAGAAGAAKAGPKVPTGPAPRGRQAPPQHDTRPAAEPVQQGNASETPVAGPAGPHVAAAPLTTASTGATEASGFARQQTPPADAKALSRPHATKTVEGGQAARKPARAQSVVGAEIRAGADGSVTQAGRAPGTDAPAGGTDLPQAVSGAAASPGAAMAEVESVSHLTPSVPVARASGPADASPAGQVAEQVHLAGPRAGQRVVVRLDPPELGHVRLTLRGGRGGIRGTIEVDNARTLAELQNAAPPMIERLAAGGIVLRRLDLVLSSQGDGGSGDAPGSSLRDGAWAQQQGDGQGPQGQSPRDRDPWADAPDQTLQPDHPRAAPVYVSDDAINLWI